MKDFFRSLFGMGGSAGKRYALGHRHEIDLKDVNYVRDANARLVTLHQLYSRYKKTPHAFKVKAVYEKTKAIQDYLISMNRVHELEIFHLQHTDHFINTFTAIINVHQNEPEAPEPAAFTAPKEEKPRPVRTPSEMETLLDNLKKDRFKESWNRMTGKAAGAGSYSASKHNDAAEAEVPKLSIPAVSINTFEKIPYFPVGLPARAIGYTSTSSEKEDFLRHLSYCLSIDNITYLGNAPLQISGKRGAESYTLLPVIRWKASLYAIDMSENRLFPVKTLRQAI